MVKRDDTAAEIKRELTRLQFQWLDQIAADPEIEPSGFKVAYGLSKWIDHEQFEASGQLVAWRPHEALGAEMHISARTVRRQLKAIEERGHLEATRVPNKATRYTLIVRKRPRRAEPSECGAAMGGHSGPATGGRSKPSGPATGGQSKPSGVATDGQSGPATGVPTERPRVASPVRPRVAAESSTSPSTLPSTIPSTRERASSSEYDAARASRVASPDDACMHEDRSRRAEGGAPPPRPSEPHRFHQPAAAAAPHFDDPGLSPGEAMVLDVAHHEAPAWIGFGGRDEEWRHSLGLDMAIRHHGAEVIRGFVAEYMLATPRCSNLRYLVKYVAGRLCGAAPREPLEPPAGDPR